MGKYNKGVSLIVLVITIIVIIILAGSVIINLSSNNPITKSNEAKVMSDLSTLLDKYNLAYGTALANNLGVVPTDQQVQTIFGITSLPTGYAVSNKGIIYTGTDAVTKQQAQLLGADVVPIPAGFYYVKGAKSTGFVISSDSRDAYGATEGAAVNSYGDQFVWIPIDLVTDDTITPFKKRALAPTKDLVTSANLSSWTDDTLPNATELNNSIANYKGFYVARYEASCVDVSGTTITAIASKKSSLIRTSPGTGSNAMKAGMLINYITYSGGAGLGVNIDGTNYSTIGAKTLAEQMASNKGWTSVGSNLITGAQWDTMMQWISQNGYNVGTDSRTWGNYYDTTFGYSWPTSGTKSINTQTLLNTGTETTRNISNNISDLAGNVWEWTNEIYSGGRSHRGGAYYYYGDAYTAACRNYNFTNTSSSNIGFRPALYLK